jgi:hypothetical protein
MTYLNLLSFDLEDEIIKYCNFPKISTDFVYELSYKNENTLFDLDIWCHIILDFTYLTYDYYHLIQFSFSKGCIIGYICYNKNIFDTHEKHGIKIDEKLQNELKEIEKENIKKAEKDAKKIFENNYNNFMNNDFINSINVLRYTPRVCKFKFKKNE